MIYFYYASKNTFRSNKFLISYVLLYFILFLNYMSFSFLSLIVPDQSYYLIFSSIILFDFFLKYYLPGLFIENVNNFFKISLSRIDVSLFLIFNVVFTYSNFAIIFSGFFGVPVDLIISILCQFILSHFVVLQLKMNSKPTYNNTLLFNVFLLISNLLCAIIFKNIIPSIGFVLSGFIVFNYHINHLFHAK